MVSALTQRGLLDSTLIIITAKHGDSPMDLVRYVAQLNVGSSPATVLAQANCIPLSGSPLNPTGIGPTEDDISLIWLSSSCSTSAAIATVEQSASELAIVPLICARQPRGRQVERAGGIAVASGRNLPIPPAQQDRRAAVGRVIQQDPLGLLRLRPDHHRDAGLHDPGLLRRDRRQGLAQEFPVVQRDGGDRGGGGGGITLVASPRPPSPASSTQGSAGARANRTKAAAVTPRTGDRAAASRARPPPASRPARVGNQGPGQPKALIIAHEVGVVATWTRRPAASAYRAQEGAGAALAVGAGDMEDRRQLNVPARPASPVGRSADRG